MSSQIFKLLVSLLFVVSLFQFQFVVYAEPNSATVVINEIQTNGVGTGTTGQEFIELKNIASTAVDIGGWKLQYIASTGNLATAKYFVTFASPMVINPGGYILITPELFLTEINPRTTYAITSAFAGLAASGGTVQLVDAINVVVDEVGWGTKTGTIVETEPAMAPSDGGSIQRKVIDGLVVDTDNNKNDFESLLAPTPQADNPAPETSPPDPDPVDPELIPDSPPGPEILPDTNPVDSTGTTDETPLPENTPPETTGSDPVNTPQPILLNELFIDPASPLTDANDEWVELYNPNDNPQNLAGYSVYAGDTYAYHHTFSADTTIAARGYISISSAGTSIALANGSGRVKIVGPTGQIYDETTYETAKSGESWAKNGAAEWQWTLTPTLDAANIITQSPTVALVTKAVASAKKTTATKSTATKTAATKVVKDKVTKVKAATKTVDDSQPALVAAPTPLPLWLLALLGVLAVLYSGYEYRFDIANKFYQFKQYRASRQANRR